MTTLEFFNPTGVVEVLHEHAPRLVHLENKRIGFLSNGDWQSFRSLPLLKKHLEEDFTGIEVLAVDAFPEGTEHIGEDAAIDAVIASGVDAVILGNAACGACSTACGVAAARLELNGIPTVTVTRHEFVEVVRNAVSGVGLPADLAMATFPIDLFLPDSDLSPLSARRDEIYRGLTSWTPEHRDEFDIPRISIDADSYEDALEQANNLFLGIGGVTGFRSGRRRRSASNGSSRAPTCLAIVFSASSPLAAHSSRWSPVRSHWR